MSDGRKIAAIPGRNGLNLVILYLSIRAWGIWRWGIRGWLDALTLGHE
jgi:hypothetical protein